MNEIIAKNRREWLAFRRSFRRLPARLGIFERKGSLVQRLPRQKSSRTRRYPIIVGSEPRQDRNLWSNERSISSGLKLSTLTMASVPTGRKVWSNRRRPLLRRLDHHEYQGLGPVGKPHDQAAKHGQDQGRSGAHATALGRNHR